jgi:DNA topoisomerase-1
MAAAEIDTVTLDIACNQHVFRSTGETVVFPGYLAQYVETSDDKTDEDAAESKAKLPMVIEGDQLKLISLSPEQKFTHPPARYTEATLIKAMEEKGIGRPSTYAPTISTIMERNYVEKMSKFLAPTELGIIVTRLLSENFEKIVDTDFTAKMEESLDGIELGKSDWVEVLSNFYGPFHELIEKASNDVARVEMAAQATGEKCPECKKGDLLIKEGRYGKFVACSDFPECKYTATVQTPVDAKCPKCGSGLVSRESRKFKGRVFYTCDKKGSNAECDFISWDMPLDGQNCEVCGQYKVMKKFRGKSYTKCSNRECPTNRSRKTKTIDTSSTGEEKE